MKENVFFKVGYNSYLERAKEDKESWTSKVIKKILEYKFLSLAILTVIVCTITNIILICKFVEKIQLL